MKYLLVLLLTGCSSLMPIAGGAAGAGVGAALGTPATAAIGGAAGVTAAQIAFPKQTVSSEVALAAAQAGKPAPGTAASTIHETKNLVWDLGWMYLLVFVIVPLFTKKGRGWVKKFADIHNTVSQKEIDARDEEQDVRLQKLEEAIASFNIKP